MAGFKGHAIAGASAGTILSVASIELQGMNMVEAIYLGLICYFGGLMPDIDANKSIITKNFFRYFGLFFGVFCSLILYRKLEYYYIGGIIISCSLFSIYAIKPLFNRFTSHRGLFHSLPAGLLISGLLGNLIVFLSNYKKQLHLKGLWDSELVLWASASFFVGYLVHLILDEIWSLKGMKSSLGTAFKIFEKKKSSSYFLMYLSSFILYILLMQVSY